MKPYYDDGRGITIYHGDCREFLSGISADVLVTDPPYGMAYKSGWSGNRVAGDDDTTLRDSVLEFWYPRPAAVFGRWSIKRPQNTRMRLVWDNGEWPGMGDLDFPWGPSDEEIYILGDGWHGKRTGTIVRIKRLGANGLHPTAKPLGVMLWLLSYAPPGTIIDPFAGSGTTLEAAKQSGRSAIGIEIEEKYCEIAAERLSQEVLPL